MPTGYNHLNLEKRSQIYALRATKTSTAEIARILQCHPPTITRETRVSSFFLKFMQHIEIIDFFKTQHFT